MYWISNAPVVSNIKALRQRLDGLEVVFQVLMPEDSGSNPQAGSIYFKMTEFVLLMMMVAM